MQPAPGAVPSAGVVIPIRGFRSGMVRLAGALDDDERAALAQTMAERVIAAAGSLPVVVVSSAPEVVAWAAAAGLDRIADVGTGLDGAAAAGFAHLVAQGCDRVVVAHADLPRARDSALVALVRSGARALTVVPCHRDDGTPVMVVPADTPFSFAYGPGSFRRHVACARAAGLPVRVVRDPDLGYDVDVPEDLPAGHLTSR